MKRVSGPIDYFLTLFAFELSIIGKAGFVSLSSASPSEANDELASGGACHK
jgi:hypothetical protein